MAVEQTLVVLKPDACSNKECENEIIRTLAQKDGLSIVSFVSHLRLEKDFFIEHYDGVSGLSGRLFEKFGEEKGQKIFDETLDYMTSGPVTAMIIEGEDAVGHRADAVAGPAYAEMIGIEMANVVHASGNPEEAKKEIALWRDKYKLLITGLAC